MKAPAVYITANKKNGTLYTGVTSNLLKRTYEHKHNITKGFSTKYKCYLLVYFEFHPTMISAIEKEKKIKAGSREKKIKLIEAENPDWLDLYYKLLN